MLPEFLKPLSFSKPSKDAGKAKAVAFVVTDEKKLSKSAKEMDELSGGLISKGIESGKFKGKKGQVLHLLAPNNCGYEQILIAGLGKEKDITTLTYEATGRKTGR